MTYDERLVDGEPDDDRRGTLGDLEAHRTRHHADHVDDREQAREAAVREL